MAGNKPHGRAWSGFWLPPLGCLPKAISHSTAFSEFATQRHLIRCPPLAPEARATVRVAVGRLGAVRGSRRFWVVLRRWGGCRHSARSRCFLRLGVA